MGRTTGGGAGRGRPRPAGRTVDGVACAIGALSGAGDFGSACGGDARRPTTGLATGFGAGRFVTAARVAVFFTGPDLDTDFFAGGARFTRDAPPLPLEDLPPRAFARVAPAGFTVFPCRAMNCPTFPGSISFQR